MGSPLVVDLTKVIRFSIILKDHVSKVHTSDHDHFCNQTNTVVVVQSHHTVNYNNL